MKFKNTNLYFFLILGNICIAYNKIADSTLIKTNTSRNFPTSFLENYNSSEYNYANQEPSWFENFSKWIFLLIIKFFELFIPKSEQTAKNVNNILTIFFIILTIYIILKFAIKNEGGWIFRKKQKNIETNIIDEIIEVKNSNFELLVNDAKTNSDYRNAVRFYYLWVLQKLAQKNYIKLDSEKTNADYQNELSSSKTLNNFKKSSYYYNYIWYGEFQINQNEFQQAEATFLELLNSL